MRRTGARMNRPGFRSIYDFLKAHGLKIVSVVLALAAWYGIRETISYEAEIPDVPVQVVRDDGWAVMLLTPETVAIRFRGARADLAGLSRDNVAVVLDVRGRQGEGRVFEMDLTPREVTFLGGARVARITPRRVRFSLDREVEREVTVKAEVRGPPLEGYAVTGVSCEPPKVKVRGPASGLAQLDEVRTQAIDVEGRTRLFHTLVALVPPPGLKGIRYDPDRVLVGVSMSEHTETRLFRDVPVRVLGAPGEPAARRVVPASVHIMLAGRPTTMERVDAAEIKAYVDLTGAPAGQEWRGAVGVFAPPGLRAVSVDPREVTVTVGR